MKEFATKEKLEIAEVQDFGSKCVRTILRIFHQKRPQERSFLV